MSGVFQENQVIDGIPRVQWTLVPNPAWLYQKVELTLEIAHSLDLELVPLEFGDTLGDFTVSGVVVSIPRIVEQHENHRIMVELHPNSAGPCQVGAIPIQCKSHSSEATTIVLVFRRASELIELGWFWEPSHQEIPLPQKNG